MKKTGKLSVGSMLCGALFFAVSLNAAPPTQFDFGTGAAASGYTKVTPTTMYSTAQGYGFQPSGSPITAVSRGGSDVLRGDYCTSADSFSFSIALPLGNYTATVYLGDLNGTSITSVYGEQRRLFLDRISTASGQVVAKTFTINRRNYTNGSVTISRKDRELTYADFDSVLNLTFAGSKIAVCGIDVAPAAAVTTIYVCGNSTTVDQPAEPFCCWPQMITRMFNQQVSIADYAESGEDAGSFTGEHRLAMISTVMKPGDYVVEEFGHNDQKSDANIANFVSHLKQIADSARAHNATPIYVTPTARKAENDSATSVGSLADSMRKAAKAQNVILIDLNVGVIALHKSLGTANVAALYASTSEDTHSSDYGALEFARIVATAIKGLNLNIAQDLLSDLPLFDPSKPDPLDYLTTPTPPGETMTQSPSEVQKTFSNAFGLSINMPAHVVRFTPGKEGAAVLSIFSLAGKQLAEKRTTVAQAQGSLTWQDLGALPMGIYIFSMSINDKAIGKTMICKL
ncbi:MAG: GDSL-type esterase/lipase family protein [Chitinivibrionales bacterium]